jgi:myo-inositol-1(or 4)-monophosphatase
LPDSDPAQLRAPLEAIMRDAGELARETSRGPFKRWTKGHDKSPVSEGDIAVNDFLFARLNSLAPGTAWISEETEEEVGEHTLAWVVDPIDGTRAYISGRDDWTVSVALVEHGRPVLAALYAPVLEEMFLAVQGAGATLNGKPIAVSGGAELAGARFSGPKPYLERLAALSPQILPQPRIYSLALRLTRVAQGTLEGAFASHGSHSWDLAAADLLVHEAGGALTDFTGRSLSHNQPEAAHGALIAAGAARHRTLIDLVSDHLAEFA